MLYKKFQNLICINYCHSILNFIAYCVPSILWLWNTICTKPQLRQGFITMNLHLIWYPNIRFPWSAAVFYRQLKKASTNLPMMVAYFNSINTSFYSKQYQRKYRYHTCRLRSNTRYHKKRKQLLQSFIWYIILCLSRGFFVFPPQCQ